MSGLTRLIKYFFVGGAAAVVDIGLFLALLSAEASVQAAGTVSFLVATLVNFILARRFVFADRQGGRSRLIATYAVSFVGLLLNQWVLWIGTERFQWPPLAAKLLATGLVFFWNYGIRNYYVFKP